MEEYSLPLVEILSLIFRNYLLLSVTVPACFVLKPRHPVGSSVNSVLLEAIRKL